MDDDMTARAPNGQVAEWIRFISSVLVIPAFAFGFVWMIRMDRSLAGVEASRFTATDGLKMQQQHAEQLAAIWTEMSNIRVAIADLPPDDFVAYVRRIEGDLHALELEVASRAAKSRD